LASFNKSLPILCHLSESFLKAELAGIDRAEQNAIKSLNAFHLGLDSLSAQDSARDSDTFRIANWHNFKDLSHVYTVITFMSVSSILLPLAENRLVRPASELCNNILVLNPQDRRRARAPSLCASPFPASIRNPVNFWPEKRALIFYFWDWHEALDKA
jgi:hypothetical protein